MSFEGTAAIRKYICKHCYAAIGDHSICTCATHRTHGLCHVICATCAKSDARTPVASAGIAVVNAAWTNPLHRETIKRSMRLIDNAFHVAPRGNA